MENKRTIIGIIIVVILIILLIAISYLYNDFNTKQLNLLTEETNNLLEKDITKEEINLDIQTKQNYAVVEKSIKEYMMKLKNIYLEVNEINTQINPNNIFSASNIEDKDFTEINNIIEEYRNKSKECISEYQDLIKDENIIKYIENEKITFRKDYYTNLFKTTMLSDVMKEEYRLIQTDIENEKDEIYSKTSVLERIKKYLEDNDDYWTIKDDKIQFANINRMTEYYNLLNELVN